MARRNNKSRKAKFQLENLESRRVMSADPVFSLSEVAHGPECGCAACCNIPGEFDHSHTESDVVTDIKYWQGDLFDGRLPPEDVNNPLTIIVDFNDASQGTTTDGIGNQITTFDPTIYGFINTPQNREMIENAVLARTQEYFQGIASGLPSGEQLKIEFELGDIGDTPMNGSNDYYYVQVGTAADNTSTILGQAFLGAARTSLGVPVTPVGSVFGSVFTDNIQTMTGFTPSNALTSGNVNFTALAIANTLAHEIGHGVSLNHINTIGTITPTGLPPVMGTGAIDATAQDQIDPNEFSVQGINDELLGVVQRHIDQLEGAIGTHDATLPFNLTDADQGYAYAFPFSSGNRVDDTMTTAMNINIPGDVDSYFFTPQFTNTYTIELSTSAPMEPLLGIYDATSGAKLTFDAGSATESAKLTMQLNANQRYLIAGGDVQSDKTGLMELDIWTSSNSPISNIPVSNLQGSAAGILSNGDMQAFRVVAPTGTAGTMEVNLNAGFTLDGVLVVWDASGNEILRRDELDIGGDESLTLNNVAPGDEFVFTVFAKDYATAGSFSIDVEFSNSALPDTMTSANRGYAYAFATDPGEVVDNTVESPLFIGTGSEIDSVYFAPQASGEYEISVSNPNGSSVDPIVAIYNASTGTQLAIDNDGGPNDDAKINISLDARERYIIAIGDVGANSTGVASLNIETSEPVAVSDTFISSNGEGQVTTNIGSSGDVDFYRFVAPSGAYGRLDVTMNPEAALDGAIVLWDDQGNVLDRSDFFGNNGNENVSIEGVTPGEVYTVSVFASDYLTTGFATLAIDFEIFSSTQIVVDNIVDELDGDFSPGDLSLREAIALADANPGPDTISFANSVTGTMNLTGGEFQIRQPLLIVGPGADQLTIDAGASSRHFHVSDGTNFVAEVEIRGLTLANGASPGGGNGGSILSDESLTLRESVLTGNSSGSSGGALSVSSTGLASTLIEDVQFLDNSAIAGGAINSTRYDVTVIDSLFDGNSSMFGGAVRGFNTDLSILRSEFIHNSSNTAGGALALLSGSLTVQDSRFDDNTAVSSNYDGGAIYAEATPISILGSHFVNNSAGDDGGALALVSSPATVSGSSFDGNSAPEGGAVHSDRGIDIRDSTLSNNSANLGGALWAGDGATLVQATISGNLADGS
ncbi:MAG: hypothetical protein AAF497_08710, partial [Planctomycetota bacterium]